MESGLGDERPAGPFDLSGKRLQQGEFPGAELHIQIIDTHLERDMSDRLGMGGRRRRDDHEGLVSKRCPQRFCVRRVGIDGGSAQARVLLIQFGRKFPCIIQMPCRNGDRGIGVLQQMARYQAAGMTGATDDQDS
jgi:hypothetical protein